MEGSFEVTKTWTVPGEIVDRPVYLQVNVEPLESEFVLRYRNRVTWKAACLTGCGWLWLFDGSKTFATNSNTREEILSEIKERLGAL